MYKIDHQYSEESKALGYKYAENDEGLSVDAFVDKYGSEGFRQWYREFNRLLDETDTI